MTITFLFEVDWANNGSWIDESAQVLLARVASGFKEGVPLTERVAAVGTCSLTLDNSSQRYSPDYASGPLYGNLLPRRPIRVRATDGVTTWTVFRGYINDIVPQSGMDGSREVVITCADLLQILTDEKISLELIQNKSADQLLATAVDAALWTAFATATITVTSVPTSLHTFTLNGQVYTFAFPPTTAYQVTNPNAGVLPDYLAYLAQNLAACINAGAGAGSVYGSGTLKAPGVAATVSSRVITLTATLPGAIGNLNTLSITGGWATLSGSTFTGGIDVPVGLINYQLGTELFDVAADRWASDTTTAYDVIRDIVHSDQGRFFVQRNGTLTFLNRRWFFKPLTTAVVVDDTSPVTVEAGRYIDTIANIVHIVVQPRSIVGAPGVIASSNASIKLPAASVNAPLTRKVALHFRDSSNNAIGGKDLVLPLAIGTDLIVGTARGASDYNNSPSWSIGTPDIRGSEVILPFKTTALGPLYVSNLQVRGKPVTNFAPVTVSEEDATSQASYQKRLLAVEMPLASDDSLADSLATYLLNRYKTPFTDVRKLTFYNHSVIGSVNLFSIDLFNVISVSDSQIGLSAAKVYVIGIQLEITPSTYALTFITSRADENIYWNLGTVGYGELGTNTRLAA